MKRCQTVCVDVLVWVRASRNQLANNRGMPFTSSPPTIIARSELAHELLKKTGERRGNDVDYIYMSTYIGDVFWWSTASTFAPSSRSCFV